MNEEHITSFTWPVRPSGKRWPKIVENVFREVDDFVQNGNGCIDLTVDKLEMIIKDCCLENLITPEEVKILEDTLNSWY